MEKTFESRLLQFQTQIGIIKKDSKNPHFKSSYTTLNDILAEVKPLLSELGLIILQPINHDLVTTVITCAETGESVSSSISMPSGLNPQQLGSAVTYFRRYALSSALGLVTDKDTDASGEQVKHEPKKPSIDQKRLGKALEAIAGGKYTKEELLSNFTLTDSQLTLIENV